MKLYKLTDSNGQTRGNCQWGENITHRAARGTPELCSPTVVHAYRDPYLAVFHDAVGGRYGLAAQLWEATGRVTVSDWGKVGCKKLTTLRQIPLPVLTTEQRVRIAIRCALLVYTTPEFRSWARAWLDGSDRTTAATDAARAARAAAYAASAAAYAASAASAAAYAARAASAATDAARAASAAAYAARAADAAAYAADAAAYAVRAVDAAADILKIIREEAK